MNINKINTNNTNTYQINMNNAPTDLTAVSEFTDPSVTQIAHYTLNRKHKDSLFRLVFQEKRDLLDLYNALNNINYGHNMQILNNCAKLREYSLFVHNVRQNQKVYPNLKDAVDAAIDESIKNHILDDILIKHRAEVRNMILTKFDQEAYEKALKAEAQEIGLKQGLEQGSKNCMWTLIRNKLSLGKPSSKIAEELDTTVEIVEQIIHEFNQDLTSDKF